MIVIKYRETLTALISLYTIYKGHLKDAFSHSLIMELWNDQITDASLNWYKIIKHTIYPNKHIVMKENSAGHKIGQTPKLKKC